MCHCAKCVAARNRARAALYVGASPYMATQDDRLARYYAGTYERNRWGQAYDPETAYGLEAFNRYRAY